MNRVNAMLNKSSFPHRRESRPLILRDPGLRWDKSQGLIRHCGRLLAVAALLFASPLSAQLSSSDFAALPPLITNSATPNVMLVMSNDHELYRKAYPDYSDLDNDGVLDTSYNDSFTYSGYFDSNFCYRYDGSDNRFEPDGDISALIGSSGHRCNLSGIGGQWSGNFLNWASMTRMDIVRHVLYGGRRIEDTASGGGSNAVTVLERSFIPEDVHSFVKVFAGDTERYTPYEKSAVSLCNTTFAATSNPPLLRVAFGGWPQWSASEVVQCHYRGEAGSDNGSNKPGTSSSDRPSFFDFRVRVSVCEAGIDSASARCKPYINSVNGNISYKPFGLLQQYGDGGSMNFGLMSGSYNKKIDGGVLRKNILPLVGNAASGDNEINPDNGAFINQGASDGGIINTLNRFRIVNWSYTNNNYSDCDTFSITINTFKTSASGNRQCRNWGNPLSEIYLEALRYFTGDEVGGAAAGAGVPTTAFDVSDANQIASLPQLAWQDPLNVNNACAACSIIVISTGLNSFDTDDLASVTDVWDVPGSSRLSAGKLNTLLNSIGTLEGINGSTFLIGENGSGIDDGKCTAKTLPLFANAKGLCPEIPSLEGGFTIAALARHARTADLRNAFEGVQDVRTFTVALAENLPSLELAVNGKTVSFVPTCQSAGGGTKLDQSGWSDCSLVDVTVESADANGGRLLIAWEDSLWGNDYDMDGIARLEYCIGTDTSLCPGRPANTPDDLDNTSGSAGGNPVWSDFEWKTSGLSADSVQFRMSIPQANAGNALRFGYIISGVQDGLSTTLFTNAPSAVRNNAPTTGSGGKFVAQGTIGNGEQSFLLRQGGFTISRLSGGGGNQIIYTEPAVYSASSLSTAGSLLKNPLWYAAKYGSFIDIDGDGTPQFGGNASDTREWDVRDTEGNPGADGIPDNFFPVRNPSRLLTSLNQVFEAITGRISSGTAAAVVANSSTGLGAVYQAYYHPSFTDPNDTTVSWGGVLHAMFIDESGRFREDNGSKGTLEDTDTDFVVNIFFDQSVVPSRTRFQRFTQTGSGASGVLTPLGQPVDLELFGSIWNARDVLGNISQTDLLTQRGLSGVSGKYNEPAQNKRYIFTYLDDISSGTLGVVDPGEVLDLVDSNFDPGTSIRHRYLGLANPMQARDVIRYIRGQDMSGFRSRLADIPGDGTTTPRHWLLGDIVHSSPLVVNPPDARFDINFGDTTYDTFKRQYQRRRQMIYAGANDGMLHGFNGGVWDPLTKTFFTQTFDELTGTFTGGEAHALGAEMWAYVPMSLLPHLQWLTEEAYPHVYYMDAPPLAFDANIFTADAVHPGGWGTVLVAGMRLGGGEFPLDLDDDGSDETLMRSSFVIMDITDPERPPTLIAEISPPNLGFTTSNPTLIRARIPDSSGSFSTPQVNRWLLVFGSGPDSLDTATSVSDPRIFAYDLVARSLVTIDSAAQVSGTNPSGFFGDFQTVDWNNDFVDDTVYAGTVEGSALAPGGRMKRIVLANQTAMGLSTGGALMSDLLVTNQPIMARPVSRVDVARDERWILFASGRLFTRDDNELSQQQSVYGVKEPANFDTSLVSTGTLVNTTNILVETNGNISDSVLGTQVTLQGSDLDTFAELNQFMDGEAGWVRDLFRIPGQPSERVFNMPLVLGSSLVYSSYLPSADLCTIEGEGFINSVNFRTGTAEAFGPLGSSVTGVAFASLELGQGAPSTPTAIIRTGDEVGVDGSSGGDMTVITGSTTGVTENTTFNTAPGSGGRMSWEMLDIPF
ncbi:MAG: PilC/PilY family type IV pilus protein [Pseudomonadales bacterium]|nr:PilC/PilY family type IV pilus protein [Pseudomonadales bacterium]